VPYRSVNPATGEVFKIFLEHTDEQMWSALATADKAFVNRKLIFVPNGHA
jgi:hypothetical protein